MMCKCPAAGAATVAVQGIQVYMHTRVTLWPRVGWGVGGGVWWGVLGGVWCGVGGGGVGRIDNNARAAQRQL